MSTCRPLTSWYSSISRWSNASLHGAAGDLVGGQRTPVQEQVVEVEHSQRPLAGRVRLEERGHRFDVVLAPREVLGDDAGQRLLGVHRARVDVEQRALLREAPLALRVPVLLADHVDQIRRVAGVEHPEAGRQVECGGMHAHEAVRNGMERPAQYAAGPRRHGNQRARAPQHLARRAAGEREQHDPLRRHALGHQPGHPRAQRRGLAGARAGQDQQRAAGVGGRCALPCIQIFEPRGAFRSGGGITRTNTRSDAMTASGRSGRCAASGRSAPRPCWRRPALTKRVAALASA